MVYNYKDKMLPFIYLAAFFISLFEMIIFYESRIGKNNQNRMLLFVSSFVANYVCAMIPFAATIDGAVCGTQLYFIGNTLTFVFELFVIADICKIKINRNLERLFFLVAFIIMVLVATCYHTELFFKNMEIDTIYGANYLKKDYGTFYFIYPCFVFLTSFSSILVIIIAMSTGKKISEKTVRYLLIILLATAMGAVISRMTNVHLEIYPFVNIILCAFLLFIFRRASMYDMTENLINVYSQRQEYGYISFDLKKRFLGCNEYALKLIPELKNAIIDEYLDEEKTPYYTTILSWLNEWDSGKKEELKLMNGGLSAMASIRSITYGKKSIGYLIELRDVTSHQKYLENLEGTQHDLELAVEEKTQKIINIQDSIITGIASMVESRDNSTGDHIRRTSEGVRIFVDQIKKHSEYSNLDPTFCLNVVKAAPLHDLGKIAVDDSILKKPGKFVPEEYDEMKEHASKGAEIVAGVLRQVDDKDFKIIAINVAHYHHERWNGKGYPEGLAGEQIPLEARIMAFADVFDALVTKRCYKEAIGYDEAFEMMEKDFGQHFDPELGKVFLECKVALAAMYTLDALLNKDSV